MIFYHQGEEGQASADSGSPIKTLYHRPWQTKGTYKQDSPEKTVLGALRGHGRGSNDPAAVAGAGKKVY